MRGSEHKWHNDENFTDAKYNDGSDMSWNQDSHAGWYKQLSKRAKAASRNRGAVRSWNRGASWASAWEVVFLNTAKSSCVLVCVSAEIN